MYINYIRTDDILYKNSKLKYIAVSYVWSQNDMAKLTRYIEKYLQIINQPEVPIWLDKVSNRDELGNNNVDGIKNMNVIYDNATITLAIVPELWYIDLAKLNQIEKMKYIDIYYMCHQLPLKDVLSYMPDYHKAYDLMDEVQTNHVIHRLANCEWFRRAWTFQEQILSKKIETIINGKVYNITKIVHDLIVINMYGVNIKTICNKFISNLQADYLTYKDKVSIFLSSFIESNWDSIYIDEIDGTHIRKKCEIQLRCKNRNLSLVEALALVSDRVMGKENKGYEPIESLISDNLIHKGSQEKLPIRVFATNEERMSMYRNMCWLPKRLNTDEELFVFSHNFVIQPNGMIIIKEGIACIDKTGSTILYYIGRVNQDLGLYVKLHIICSESQREYLTHFMNTIKDNIPQYLIENGEYSNFNLNDNIVMIGAIITEHKKT